MRLELDYYIPRNNQQLETIYFGGGTPSSISAEKLSLFINDIENLTSIKKIKEFTIEINPEISENDLNKLMSLPFNRISIGVQSFKDDLLILLGRRVNRKKLLKTLSLLVSSRFNNISCDLIIGIPGQSEEDLKNDLKILRDFNINHISVYCLEIRKRDPFYKILSSKGIKGNTRSKTAHLYEIIQENLENFDQYEISNFANNNTESIHNKNYWNLTSYLGVGISAHSFLNLSGKMFRWKNRKNLSNYLAINNHKDLPIIKEQSKEISKFEFIFLSLRTKDGISADLFENIFKENFFEIYKEELDLLCSLNLIEIKEKCVKIPRSKYLLSNSILNKFCKYK